MNDMIALYSRNLWLLLLFLICTKGTRRRAVLFIISFIIRFPILKLAIHVTRRTERIHSDTGPHCRAAKQWHLIIASSSCLSISDIQGISVTILGFLNFVWYNTEWMLKHFSDKKLANLQYPKTFACFFAWEQHTNASWSWQAFFQEDIFLYHFERPLLSWKVFVVGRRICVTVNQASPGINLT